jgi:hypothetical protein
LRVERLGPEDERNNIRLVVRNRKIRQGGIGLAPVVIKGIHDRAKSEAPMGLRRKLSPMPPPWRVNKLLMAVVSCLGFATSFRRYIAESVVAAPNPSIV